MDIRTKLVFALVAVALGSMAALGIVMSIGAMEALRESRLQQLDGLAEAKREGLEQVLRGWEDRVRLIASRTQLRLSLREHQRTGSEDALGRMDRILTDALDATDGVESLSVHDPSGVRVVAVTRNGPLPSTEGTSTQAPPGDVAYDGVSFAGGGVTVRFRAGLTLEDEALGTLVVRLTPRELFEFASIRTGLGETGETLIVLPGPGLGRDARVVRPAPGGGPAMVEPVDSVTASGPVRVALDGTDGVFREGLVDGGGDPVWAATRHVPGTGWGVVVKLDAEEGRAPVVELRRELTSVGLSLAAFAILAGTILGFRFARPILDLSAVADRIREGDLGARASVQREDEVGVLARTFNQMAEGLEERVSELREFHTFFEVSLDMLCIAGTDGYFKRVNPAFQRTLGWSPEALLSRPIPEFVHPDDEEATARELARLAEGVPTISFENRFRRADGRYRTLRWTCHPDPESGLLYAVARDVTSRSDAGESRSPGRDGPSHRATPPDGAVRRQDEGGPRDEGARQGEEARGDEHAPRADDLPHGDGPPDDPGRPHPRPRTDP